MNPVDDTTESFMNPVDYSGRAKDPVPIEEEHYEGFWRPTYSTWNDYAPSAPAPLKSQKNVVQGPTAEEIEAQIQLERQRELERLEQQRLKQQKFQEDLERLHQLELQKKFQMDMERINREQREQERARAEKQRLEMERLERIEKKRREEQRQRQEEEEQAELERQLLFEPSPGFAAVDQDDLDNYGETTNVNSPSPFPSGPFPSHLLNESPSDHNEMDQEPLPSNASDVFDQYIDNSMFVDTPGTQPEVKEEEYLMPSDEDTLLTDNVNEQEDFSSTDGDYDQAKMTYGNFVSPSSSSSSSSSSSVGDLEMVDDIVPAAKPLVPIDSWAQPDGPIDELLDPQLIKDGANPFRLLENITPPEEPADSGEDLQKIFDRVEMRKIHDKKISKTIKKRRQALEKKIAEISSSQPSIGNKSSSTLREIFEKANDASDDFEKERIMQEASLISNLNPFTPLNDLSETENRFGHLLLDKRFQHASKAAYNKLSAQAMRSSHPGLAYFLLELGDETSVVARGFKSLENLLDHKLFSSLLDVYSFLHVAYAMSQTETTTPCHSTPAEFKSGLDVLRNCLDDSPKHVYSETEVFDHIVEIMWSEIDQAMYWLGKQEGIDFMDTLKRTARKLQKTRNLLKRAQISQGMDVVLATDDDDGGEILAVTAGVQKRSTWQDVVTGSIFGMVIGFMRAASDTWTDYMGSLSKTAYSFLLHPLEDASLGLQEYIANFFDQAFHTEDGINKTFPSSIFGGALDLLREGTISTLRGFENYMLSLGELASKTRGDFLHFTEAVLRQCSSCASLVSDDNKSKLHHKSVPEYSVDYVAGRFISADNYYSPPSTPKMDNTSRRSSNATATTLESDSTSSEMVWTPETQTKEETPATLTPPSRKQSSTPDVAEIDIVCRQSGCGKAFTTRPNLYRHQRVAHPEAAGQSTEYACGVKGCKAVLRRKDNVHKHRRKVHGIMEKQKVYRA